MSMYTIGEDEVGYGTLERLEGAARRGCDVRLLYDYLGSIDLQEEDLEPLRTAGGRVTAFNRVWPPWKVSGRLGIRNHRKLILIDNGVGFCGGMNLAEDYGGTDFGEWFFDDTVVCLQGPCVVELLDVFARTWLEETGEDLPLPARCAPHPDGLKVEVLETDPRRPETRLIEVLGGAIGSAERYCHITTPYFIPAPWLLQALERTLRRGADVLILTAGRTDAALARLAGHHFYGDLLRKGARIFEMHGRVIHTKKMVLDDAFCTVGSYNFDLWTSKHVLDTSIVTIDRDLAQSLEKELADDLQESEEITLEAWEEEHSRLDGALQWAALQCCKMM